MDIAHYIAHPEQLDRDTLYQLRELVARHPYFSAARMLYLQNLFLMHDPTFGEEMRRSAIFLSDRKVLFDMVEGSHYHVRPAAPQPPAPQPDSPIEAERGQAIIDHFLQHAPTDDSPRRKPTMADVATDYTAFLLQMDDAVPEADPAAGSRPDPRRSERNTALVEDYIGHASSRIELKDKPEYEPQQLAEDTPDAPLDDDCFTETLARIYIKQGRYERAAEIIRRLNASFPKKNAYFADQIRFLEKAILNERHNPTNKTK